MRRCGQEPGDGEGGDHGTDFAAHCVRCLHELRQTRATPREQGWRGRLAWHRTRLGALLTADAELGKRIAAIRSGRRSSIPAEVRAARADALICEAARRGALTAQQRRAEASVRRRLTADNLAALRGGIHP